MKLGKPKILPPCANVRGGDYSWEPDAGELAVIRRELKLRNRLKRRFAVLERMGHMLDRLQEAQLARISAEIAQEREWLERERLWDERLAAIQNYYLGEREKEARAADKIRREKCSHISKEIRRAAARTEREELIKRGVFRGRVIGPQW